MSTDLKQKIRARALIVVKDVVVPIVVAVLIAAVILQFIQFAIVPTESMEPTIPAKSFLVGSRRAYKNDDPARGDIVIFEHEGIQLIKRIVALPGESVQIINGQVLIDGETLHESYIIEDGSSSFGTITVPSNAYFVLGDNRNHSLDARYWNIPYVTFDSIKSKAIYMIYPKFETMLYNG